MRYITLISFFIAQQLLGQDNIVSPTKLMPNNESIEFVENSAISRISVLLKKKSQTGKLSPSTQPAESPEQHSNHTSTRVDWDQ